MLLSLLAILLSAPCETSPPTVTPPGSESTRYTQLDYEHSDRQVSSDAIVAPASFDIVNVQVTVYRSPRSATWTNHLEEFGITSKFGSYEESLDASSPRAQVPTYNFEA